MLTRLKNAELLSYRWEESTSGPPRKYFSLTPKGAEFYKELETTWFELANAVKTLTQSEDADPNQQKQTTTTSTPSSNKSIAMKTFITGSTTNETKLKPWKQVININFQGRVVPIEVTAYDLLKNYTDSLNRLFANEEGKEEIINDIESRIGELFQERITKGATCITDDDVKAIIKSMAARKISRPWTTTHSPLRHPPLHTVRPSRRVATPPLPAINALFRNEDDKLLGGLQRPGSLFQYRCSGGTDHIPHIVIRRPRLHYLYYYGIAVPSRSSEQIGGPRVNSTAISMIK